MRFGACNNLNCTAPSTAHSHRTQQPLCFPPVRTRRGFAAPNSRGPRCSFPLWSGIMCFVLEDNLSFNSGHTKGQYAAAYRSLTHPFACMASGTAQLSLVPCFAGVSGSVVLKPKLFFTRGLGKPQSLFVCVAVGTAN
ncbi:hypothetical protein DPX39_090041300 [Trypanosoma brucei equiperdum]|uniref:Uncharacterized protein n=1 Tax=Trypanosoma brucei equiperdum TaxID=630700 RepID=A0A3L6L5L7_9TRYP|nr:hypothetical protein DPX39_090041300 [Trypanosoma brucei equiperdum]